MKLIYEKSVSGRHGVCPPQPGVSGGSRLIDARFLRSEPAVLPEMPESEVVRHFTNLSRLNFCIDANFYPLGSCTMKYNPKACEAVAALPGFTKLHPLWPQLCHGGRLMQGALRLLFETERMLSRITGMAEFTLQPLAGAHGELTGVMLIAAFHRDRGHNKTQLLIPDSAHGTNPSSAKLAGFEPVIIPSNKKGMVDIGRLRAAVNEKTAGMMLTNPNTLGLFEQEVREIADIVHSVDGLMYYDGANFNAVIGRCKPAEQGFDVCHLNLHKTFASPHGGGGPGAGPVGVVEKLRPYLPISRVARTKDGSFTLDYDHPKSIGYVAPFYGNFGVLVRAYAYCLMVGGDGLRDVSNRAVLAANYVLQKLTPHYPAQSERCMHECVVGGKPLNGGKTRALDVAKALIDKGFHPPTIYFPAIVPEALMIEPTETETRETLDAFVDAMIEIAATAVSNPDALKAAPVSSPVGRLDEVTAARDLDVAFPS